MPKQKLVVGVTGGRSYADYYTVQKTLAKVASKFDITVVHGAAKGADTLADVWCKRVGVTPVPYPADWDSYGDGAGPKRNQQMVDEGGIQLLLSFPGGSGTRDMTNRCLAANIPVKIIPERVTNESASSV